MASDMELAKLYCSSLDEIRVRISLVQSVCDGAVSAGSKAFDYEIISVNIRKILELIAFGSLTANKEAYARVYANFEKHWTGGRSNYLRISKRFIPTFIQPR